VGAGLAGAGGGGVERAGELERDGDDFEVDPPRGIILNYYPP